MENLHKVYKPRNWGKKIKTLVVAPGQYILAQHNGFGLDILSDITKAGKRLSKGQYLLYRLSERWLVQTGCC
jgi:hypothetical protein